MAGYIAQAGAFTAAGAALSAYALYSDIKTAGSKRKPDEGVDLSYDSKRIKLNPNVVTSPSMAFRRRSRFRRRFRRRPRKRFGRKRRSFKRAVRRVILRTIEPRKVIASEFQQAFNEEDAVGSVSYVNCPPSILVQGTQEDQVSGNQVWLKGMLLRGHFMLSLTTPSVAGCMVVVTAVHTKEQGSGFQGGFIQFQSTTTSGTNPAQVAPDVNPRFFNGAGAIAFTGDKYRVEFDKTNVKVMRQWKIPINPAGDQTTVGTMPTLFKLYCPINRKIQFEDAGELGLTTAPRRFKRGNYFFVLQVITGIPGGVNDTIVNGDFRSEVFVRDI